MTWEPWAVREPLRNIYCIWGRLMVAALQLHFCFWISKRSRTDSDQHKHQHNINITHGHLQFDKNTMGSVSVGSPLLSRAGKWSGRVGFRLNVTGTQVVFLGAGSCFSNTPAFSFLETFLYGLLGGLLDVCSCVRLWFWPCKRRPEELLWCSSAAGASLFSLSASSFLTSTPTRSRSIFFCTSSMNSVVSFQILLVWLS